MQYWYYSVDINLSSGIETASTTEMNKNGKIAQDDKAQVINAIGGEANIITPHFNIPNAMPNSQITIFTEQKIQYTLSRMATMAKESLFLCCLYNMDASLLPSSQHGLLQSSN